MDRFAADFTNLVPAGGMADTASAYSMYPGRGAPAEPSFADALAFVDTAPGLSQIARRDLRSALISAAKLMRRQPRDIPFAPAAISDSAVGHMPKLFETKTRRRRNILSGLRTAAKLMGVIPEQPACRQRQTPDHAHDRRAVASQFFLAVPNII